MLRLSAKVSAERYEKKVPDAHLDNLSDASFKSAVEHQDAFIVDGREKVTNPVTLPPPPPPPADEPQDFQQAVSGKNKKKKKKQRSKENATKATSNNNPPTRRFETTNMFDSLASDEAAGSPNNGTFTDTKRTLDTPSSFRDGLRSDFAHLSLDTRNDDEKSSDAPTHTARHYEQHRIPNESINRAPIEKMHREPMELIPAFDSDFWDEFGNVLRVFGTQENVLRIADWKKQRSDVGGE